MRSLGDSIRDLSIPVLIPLQADRRDSEYRGQKFVPEQRIQLGNLGGWHRRLIEGAERRI
jgi:hypothetical protein